MASTTPAPMPQTEPEAPSMGVGGRLINIFISPTETFADIVRRPKLAWLAPLILLTIFAVVTAGLLIHRIGMEQIVRSELAKSSYADRLSPEQMERAIDRGVTI